MEGMIDFDLSVVEPAQRFQFWHDTGSLVYRPVDAGGDIASGLYVQSRMIQLGELVMGKMIASKQRYERTDSMVKRDHVDHFLLVLLEQGSLVWEGGGSRFVVGAGDVLLLDASTTCLSEWSEHRQVFVTIPRDLLAPLGSPWQPSSSVLHARHPYATVLAQHLRAVWECLMSGSGRASRGLGLGLATLVKAYFKDCLPAADVNGLESGEELLVTSIQDWLEGQLHQPALDAAMIGSFFHVSRSTVYELFRPWGGVKAYIQMRRLEKAMEALQAPLGQEIRIGKLASDLGFSSISVFSRAFRERWGVSPRGAKNRALAIYALNGTKPALAGPGSGSDAQEQMKHACAKYYSTFKLGRDKSSAL